MFRAALHDLARAARRGWWAIALVQLLGGLLVAVPVVIISELAGLVVRSRGGSFTDPTSLQAFALLLLLVGVLVCVPLSMVWLSAVIRIANDTLAGRRRRIGAALLEAFRRMLDLLPTVLLALGGTVLLLVLAPVVSLLGALGLIGEAVVHTVRRRRPDFAPRWPARALPLLIWIAVPGGAAARFAAGAMLSAPAVVLEGHRPLRALRAGADAARPRRLRLLGCMLLALALTIAVQMGASGLGSLLGPVGGIAGELAVQLLTAALPVVAATILFRRARAADRGGAPAGALATYTPGVVLPAARRRSRPDAIAVPGLVRRIAFAMPAVIVLAGLALAPAAPASAAPGGLALTVTSAADTLDPDALQAQQSDCLAGGGSCTLRAALLAARSRMTTTDAITIGFAGSYTIAVAAPLAFDDRPGPGGGGEETPGGGEETPGGVIGETPGAGGETSGETPGSSEQPSVPSEETPGGSSGGVLRIDGSGHRVVLDGQGDSQVLAFASNAGWGLQLASLQISRASLTGNDSFGAGVSITTSGASRIDSVTFDHDSASDGGGAVSVQRGPLTIANSTFFGNDAGLHPAADGYAAYGGADVAAMFGAAVQIVNSTFAAFSGGSLLSADSGSSIRVDNSLFDRQNGVTAAACSGYGFAGVSNVVSAGGSPDTTCPGAVSAPAPAVGSLTTPRQGGPQIAALVPLTSNTAIGGAGAQGVECSTTDQRGRTRPAVGCDAGAVALDPTSSTTLVAQAPQSQTGTDAVFTASVHLADGGTTVTTGSVQLEVDGQAVGTAASVQNGQATITTNAILAGDHAVRAVYAPLDARLVAGSTSPAVDFTVVQSTSSVSLTTSGSPATVGSSVILTALVNAGAPTVSTGSVTLRDTTAGSPGTLLGTQTLADGAASFDVSTLPAGRHTLVATYSGDAENGGAVSPVLTQVLRVPSAVEGDVSDTSVAFGAPTTVTIRVPTADGLAPATGTVHFRWTGGGGGLTLDAAGQASVVVTDLPVGTPHVIVSYDGDDRYEPSTAAGITVHVDTADTEIALRAATTSPVYGQPDALTATVSRADGVAPTGAVRFLADSTVLGTVELSDGTADAGAASGAATAVFTPSTPQLPVGTTSVTAVYVPDTSGYAASTASAVDVQVSKASADAVLATSARTSANGAPVVLTATASGATPSTALPDGTVRFLDGATDLGSAPLRGGIAQLTTTFTANGAHAITAQYSGSASFLPVTSSALTQTVVADTTTTTLQVTPGTSAWYGTLMRFAVTVTGDASGRAGTGTVRITDGLTTVATISLSGGSGQATARVLALGSHTYRAQYLPADDSLVGGSSPEVPVGVNAASTTTQVALSSSVSTQGDPVHLSATVTSPGGSPEGTVTFATDGALLGSADVVPGADGVSAASIDVGLNASLQLADGQRDVYASFTPSGAGYLPSSGRAAIRVNPGSVVPHLTLDGTRAGEPQSLTLALQNLSGTGTPAGRVRFFATAFATGAAPIDVTLPLVNGAATLAGVQLAAGTRYISATFISADGGFTASGDVNPAVETFVVTQGSPSIVLTSDRSGSVSYGTGVGLTAVLTTAGIAPTGLVGFTATGPGGTLDLGAASVTRVGLTDRWFATLRPTTIPTGSQTLTATYLGDANLGVTPSNTLTQVVDQTATTTSLSFARASTQPGTPVTLQATVRAFGAPGAPGAAANAGSVEFVADGVSVATAPVTSAGYAMTTISPRVAGTTAVVAHYRSATGDFGASDDTGSLVVLGRGTSLRITSNLADVFVGDTGIVSVTLTPEAADAGAILALPTGRVTVTDGAGHSCTTGLSLADASGTMIGACELALPTSATASLTATYAGDTLFAGSASDSLRVASRVATTRASLAARAGATWVAGSTVTLDWRITGPTEPGQPVRIVDTGTGDAVCTSSALSGSCDYVVPAARPDVVLSLSYAGSGKWSDASARLAQTLFTCVRFGSSVSPSAGGSVQVLTPPNCGASGYLPGTVIALRAVPAAGYAFASWNGAPFTGLELGLTAQGAAVQANAAFVSQCVPVAFDVVGGVQPQGGDLRVDPAPNCSDTVTNLTARGYTGLYTVGTSIRLTATVPGGIPPKKVWSWSGLAAGADQNALSQTYVVTGEPSQAIGVVFGERCAHDLRVASLTGGTVTLGGPNCTDDSGPGYRIGSSVPVTAQATGTAYFGGWNGGNIVPVSSTATSASANVRVYATNPAISADFGQCVNFTVSAPGYTITRTSGSLNGTASITPTGSCPNLGAGWYTVGTRVAIATQNTSGGKATDLVFNGWTSTLPLDQMATSTSNSLTVTASGTAEALWYAPRLCATIAVDAQPAGYLTAAATLPPGGDASCPSGQMNINLSQTGLDVTLQATSNGGDPLLGWSGTTTRWKDSYSTVDQKVPALALNPRVVSVANGGRFTAWACQAIDATLTLVSPGGERHTTPMPSDQDFVEATPAADCPIAASAYTLGQQVFPQASMVSSGYTFLGWSGAITSTDAFPTTPITIDGASKTVPLTATYQVHCFTLTTNAPKTSVSPAPNCPDTPASENKYIGGTSLAFQAMGDGDNVFREFQGGVDGQSGAYAWATIDADTNVTAYYSSKSVKEAVSDAASTVGNTLGVLAKKATGVAAAAFTAALNDNPVMLVANLAVLVGQGVQSVADLMHLQSDGLKAFTGGVAQLQQTITFMTAGLSCVSVWAANGSTSPPATVDTSKAGAAGTQLGKDLREASKAAQEARDAARATQAAAMQAAYDTRMTSLLASGEQGVWSSANAVKYTANVDDSISAQAKRLAAKFESPKAKTAGKLGNAAAVGFAVYSDYTAGGAGWDSSAADAWTNGDAYLNCLSAVVPPAYFGVTSASAG